MQVAVYIATSLDGFIADANGGIDWLMDKDYEQEGEDYGFAEFYDSTSCLVMGRNTFEKVLSFPEWPYPGKRVVVVSNTLKQSSDALPDSVEPYAGDIEALVSQLDEQGETKLYIDGGKLFQSFLQLDLVDELILTRVPVLLGSGTRLFGDLPEVKKLKHLNTKAFDTGLVQSVYRLG